MWKVIYDRLKQAGLNPYQPGKHQGLCRERYCVVKNQTQSAFFNVRTLGYRLIDIILFVPWDDYPAMQDYVDEVKVVLSTIKGLRATGTETPTIIDDSREAYTASIEYQVMKRLEG